MSKLSLSSCSHGPNMKLIGMGFGHRGIMEEFSTCYQMIELVLGHATLWPPGFSPFTNRKFMVYFYFNFRRASSTFAAMFFLFVVRDSAIGVIPRQQMVYYMQLVYSKYLDIHDGSQPFP